MKKTFILALSALSLVSLAWAAETMWIQRTDNIKLGLPLEIADSVSLSQDGTKVIFTATNGVVQTMANSEVDKVTMGASSSVVEVNYNGTDAEIVNPFAFEGVTVTKNGADVIVTSTSANELSYKLTGTTSSGSFKIYSDTKFILDLNSVSITNNDGAAINVQTGKKCTVQLTGTSNLTDASSYATVSGEDQKGCFFSEGQIVFTGSGTLNVTGNYKHGIVSDDYIDIQSGTVNVLKSANDGIRVNDYFLMSGGVLSTASTTGDGIDGDAGYIQIDGGTININLATADTKAIKCDSVITVNGGNVTLTVPAAQGKGFKTKQTMTVNGGTITANMTGAVAIVSNDPSYCTAFKTDGDFVMNDGTIYVTHSGAGGKGISADGNVNLKGGNLEITVTGACGTYTNTSGVTDNYSSTCVSADNNINVTGGQITLNVKANSAKGFKSDANTTISGGTINGTLTGNSVVVNYDPSHCTLIKCDGLYTQNGGTINATHSGTGGKGISVDGSAVFNAGNVSITTSGSAATYTASTGTDTYSPICISVDGNLNLLGGTFNVKSTGAGGKCIKSDMQIIMGTADGVSPDITTPPTTTTDGAVSQVWNYSQNSGASAAWMTYGSQVVNDMALNNGKLYVVRRNGGNTDNTIQIVNAYTGASIGSLNTSSCTAGVHYLSAVEALGSSIIACNLTNSATTNFVIYKWDSDNAAPTVLLNAAPPCTRIGDAMSVSGNATNGRIWFVYGSVVYYYTISNGAITSTTPTQINLTKDGAEYAISNGNGYGNITVESDGSFWVSSSISSYAATHFSASGAYMGELGSASQGTDLKFFTYNGTEYAAMSTYLNTSNTSIADAAVTVMGKTTGSVVGTFPSAGLGSTRNTSFRNSVCAEATTDGYYVWINVPFQGAACFKYTEPKDEEDNTETPEEEEEEIPAGEIAPLVVTAQTTGAQFGSSSSGGGQPGRPGSSTSTNGSTSPKVIKSMSAMTVYSGSFTIKSSSEGGEGLESKTTMNISGGNFYFNTYDDCINAKSGLTISGGNLRCVATGNDAVDSNGSMTLSGGLILANGAREPEEGVDVDNASQLKITGGTIINQKGNMLNLTTTQCQVPTIKYSSSISAGTLITVTTSAGAHIMSFKAPQAMSQGCYITLPEFVKNSSYKLYTGGSVSGGTVFNEVTRGGTFSGGTQVKSFTISSNLTSL